MERHNNGVRSAKIVDLVQVALMAAMVFVATSVIHIPSYMGVVHLGDSMVFIAAVLLGKRKSAIASAIGMCLFDLVHGYLIWAPFTFVIKGSMAYIAGIIAYRSNYEGNKIWNNLLAFIVSGVWMIGTYYLGGVIILMLITGEATTMNQSLWIALKDVPGNIAQVVAGILVAVPLIKVLKKTSILSKYI